MDPRFSFDRMIDEATHWIGANWLEIAIATAAGAAIYLLLNLVRGWSVKLCQRGEGAASWYSILGRAFGRTGQIFMILVAARLVVGYADAPAWLTTTVATLFTISAVFQGALWAREVVFGAIEHRMRDQEHNSRALMSALGIIRLLVTISLFAIALVVVLSNLGVNVTGLVTGLGIGGIAIGLAAQGIFADLFAALAILFDRPFRIGDSISYDKGAGSGTVESIGLKSTRIRGGPGEERIIANKKLLDFEILNTTRRLRNRFKFEFVIGYAAAPEVILKIPGLLKDAVESEGYTLIHGGVNGFVSSGISYDVEFESKEADFPADARDRVTAAILSRFRDNDISFAYPTQVNLLAEKTKPDPPAQVREESGRA
ncbi:MscS Mechanosensitive ion channel (plasmid) [Rhizorhabdus wittichii RW1]|jgi:small-conductance mechanosensitive channel|uniref:Small-conductance mechanosensitive channel n=1 Tax=Rhizorhabdus wittichii (strain DSM 6014 / CCUG 31198 / JCM 15750 / NBRC 105917 / EY 4224 / RW1) TaxID=392499 RepID=A0A9J9HGS2_RHIWR|nr:MscS Mechanosensitive ion channel [Rhizorhabdus wittichii RW1]